MNRCILLTIVVLLIASFNIYSQDVIEKKYEYQTEIGEGIILKNSTIKVDGEKTYKIFEFELPSAGNYYLNAWIMGGELENFGSGKYIEYDLFINDQKQVEKIQPEKSNWHIAALKNNTTKSVNTIKINKGSNKIVFSCNAPDIPEVEFIRLSSSLGKMSLASDNEYDKFIADIKNDVDYRKANPTEVQSKDSLSVKSPMLKNVVLPNPEGNYFHHLDVTFKYTTYKLVSFSAGQQIFISTYSPDKFEHVLELFSYSDPESYSWTSMSNSNGLASLNVNIPSSGTYYVRVRAYRQTQQGLVDLNINGQSYYSDCPVTSVGYRHAHTPDQVYNYFTSHRTGDPRIWIENSGLPGKIIGFNDDYFGGGDYNWSLNSRIKKRFSTGIGAVLLSSFSSYNPTGVCDLYIKCANSDIMSWFPNLKEDDAIQSAPQSNNYNCSSWAGGLVNLGRYFWASNPPASNNLSGNWYIAGNFWQSWDNFFGNKKYDGSSLFRFIGAPTYTRTGANSSNGEIAMWYNSTSYQYTHFSVAKPANDQPHGYDWDSKPGGLMRTFHPKNALNDNSYYGYGEISLYYRRVDASSQSYSLQESIELGLTVLPEVTLNADEDMLIQELKQSIPQEDVALFNQKMQLLVEKANTPELVKQSNPYFLYETAEFKDMLNYCKSKGSTLWPLLFENTFDDNNSDVSDLSILLINETTPEYASLMEEVKKEWSDNNYTPEGAYIAPSPINNTKNYIKKLLVVKDGKTNPLVDQAMDNDNHDLFSVFPNPFKHQTTVKFNIAENNSGVSLKVFDVNGKLLETVLSNQNYDMGTWQVEWQAEKYKSGLYLFSLVINGKTFNRRFLIE